MMTGVLQLVKAYKCYKIASHLVPLPNGFQTEKLLWK